MYISCDIDGILNYYPQCWVDFINLKLNTKFKNKEEAKNQLGTLLYKQLKSDYRNSEYKANLEIRKDAIEFLNYINENNIKIIIATSRPILNNEFPMLENLTIKWLQKNNIPFDDLIYKDEDLSYLDKFKVLFHIEDSYKYVQRYLMKNVKILYFSEKLNIKDINNSNLFKFNNFNELKEILPNLIRKNIQSNTK